MTTVKRFLFRCCTDIDEDDIFALSGIRPDFHASQDQWYSVEADEFGEQLLAVANLQFSSSTNQEKSCSAKSLVILEEALEVSNSTGTTLSKYFFRQLCNIASQSSCVSLSIEITNYSDLLVSALDELGFIEDGGYYSEDLGKMVHKFSISLNEDTSAMEENAATIETFSISNAPSGSPFSFAAIENDTNIDVNPEMKSLINDLFRALHNEST